jgi:hypothetical protein
MPQPTAEEKERSEQLRARIGAIIAGGVSVRELAEEGVHILNRFPEVETFGGAGAATDPASIAETGLRAMLNGRSWLGKNLDRWSLILDERDRMLVAPESRNGHQTETEAEEASEPEEAREAEEARDELDRELEEARVDDEEPPMFRGEETAPTEFRTRTGKVLTDADFEALADEAERGYDPEQIKDGVFHPARAAMLGDFARLQAELEKSYVEVADLRARVDALDQLRLEIVKIRANAIAAYANRLSGRLDQVAVESPAFAALADRIEELLFDVVELELDGEG